MRRGFRDALASVVPVWLSNRPLLNNGYKFLFSMMLMLDGFVEETIEGIFAGWPGVGTNTADSLIGQTRQIIRGLNEADAAYETRLREWLDAWILAGSPWGLLINVLAYLNNSALAAETVDDSGNYDLYIAGTPADPFHAPAHTGAISGPGWNWDGASLPFYHQIPMWWRLWLVIYANGVFTGPATYGSGLKWGDGSRWGITGLTTETLQTLTALLRQWKAAHVSIPWVIIAFDSTYFLPSAPPTKLPDGTWGRWGKVATVGGIRTYVPARQTTVAAYLDGLDSLSYG